MKYTTNTGKDVYLLVWKETKSTLTEKGKLKTTLIARLHSQQRIVGARG